MLDSCDLLCERTHRDRCQLYPFPVLSPPPSPQPPSVPDQNLETLLKEQVCLFCLHQDCVVACKEGHPNKVAFNTIEVIVFCDLRGHLRPHSLTILFSGLLRDPRGPRAPPRRPQEPQHPRAAVDTGRDTWKGTKS